MTACVRPCTLEAASQDSASPGPVGSGEAIARGAYEPSHGQAKGPKIRPSLIPAKHVYDGHCSVWRVTTGGVTLEELVERLQAEKVGLFGVLSATSDQIRNVTLGPSGPLAFCLVDRCECNSAGDRHPGHCEIGLCANQRSSGCEIDSPEFIDAHRQLIDLFKTTWLWPANTS